MLLGMLLVPPVTAESTHAQVTQPTAQDTAVMELQLRKEPPIEKGQVAVIQGTAAGKGLRFRLNSLSLLQPVIATVLARDPNADLRMSLFKPGRDEPSLSGSTQGEGFATLSARTQGGMDVVIDGPSGTPFALMVWVSDELTPRLAKVLVRPDEYRAWAARHPQSASSAGSTLRKSSAPAEDNTQGIAAGWVLAAFLAGGALVVVTMLVVGRRHA
jgi:hypothetical protein